MAQRFMSYRMEIWRAPGGGFRAASFVGLNRDIIVAMTKVHRGKTYAEQCLIRLMRGKHH